MFKSIKKLFDPSKKTMKSVQSEVKKIKDLDSDFSNKTDEELKELIVGIRKDLKEIDDQIPDKYKNSIKIAKRDGDYVKLENNLKKHLLEKLPEVYAAVREVLHRRVGYKHYDVQLTASTILAQGYKLTELKTGEGKTLVFQLPAALYGLTGRGSHVVTVNDYLAKRDGEYAGHILSQLGISVGIITPDASYKFIPDEDVQKYKGEEGEAKLKEQKIQNPGDCDGLNLIECTKKETYACDVVYGTNNEFGFDYLRDNMVMSTDQMSQKELYFCIVDEADSILIDEARTPLIISAPAAQSNELYVKFAGLVPKLEVEEDFTVDEKAHSVALTDEGAEKMEKLLGVKNIWQDYKLAHHLENALKAQELYKKDIHYLVNGGEVKIVDQFTGRVLDGRRYSEGLHQAIEAKEGVEIKRESKTLGTITFQNFFRLYKILAGGSGTVMTEAEEFYKIYNLESIEVPTNKPVIRDDQNDKVYKNRDAKFNAVAEEITELNKSGQPVLVGTASIEDSELLSRVLELRGIDHEVLNAKFHERESKIVANAGKKGSITVATNMAGRGTDIKLGGKNATDEDFQEVLGIGGLAVIGTQRHESRRIDNQLRGRSGRQGEQGMSVFYVALDDEIMRIQGGAFVQKVMSRTNLPDDMPISAGMVGRSIESAQKRMEGMHFDSRKSVVEYDDVVNQQREIFYARRRRILEDIEAADKAIKDNNDEGIDEALEVLKEYMKEKMYGEIDVIVDRHYIKERKDEIDAEKAVEDFLDLANDELIKEGIEVTDYESPKDSARGMLIDITYGKSSDEVKVIFKNVIELPFNQKVEGFGNELPTVIKVLVIRTMDELWTDHLDEMKGLRDGIGLRGIAQQDPLVEYKNEGFIIFDRLIAQTDAESARRLLKIQRIVRNSPAVEQPLEEGIKTNVDEVKDVTTGTREKESLLTKVGVNKALPRTSPQKTVKKSMDLGRNDKVSVEYTDGRVLKDVKYKKVENDVKTGLCRITERN